ncbi:MAG: hypothetical protein E5Y89_00490 [Mesorhizobium sp.]|nr:MAG: hypothetical protein E5Y89_00490 [Mesorhizobium sp.]
MKMDLANAAVAAAPQVSLLDRMRPAVERTIERLREKTFREDPIGGRKYSRATSIVSSAYKRHGQLIGQALLERLKDCSRLQVWREEEFKLSHDSKTKLHLSQTIPHALAMRLPYGDIEQTIPIDLIVYDAEHGTLRSYNVKRGNGLYDASKKRVLQDELIRTHMLLADYGTQFGHQLNESHAHIVFYYGLCSVAQPLSISGDALDDHFGFPVFDAIEGVNDYFRSRLYALIEEE